jgi:hypothetical protein
MVGLARSGGHRAWRVGDRVRFRYGTKQVVGTITALVGPIAAGRRMLYRIEFTDGFGGFGLATELTEDQFDRA